MNDRRHRRWLAGGVAFLLVASLSGIVSAAPLVSDTSGWVDANGNGVADGCETGVVADENAVTAALLAADLDGDGAISTSEAAQTAWVGGKNCNHGGFVSTVAQGTAEDCDAADAPDDTTDESSDTCPEDAPDADESETDAPAVCDVALAGGGTGTVAMTHVEVARSDAVGGKNCNHGGAVSESAKAAKAEREAARALKTHGHKPNKHDKHDKQDKHGGRP